MPVMSGGVDGWGTYVWWRPAGSVARGGSVCRVVCVYVYVCVRVCMCVFVCLIPRHVAHIHDEHGVGRVGVAVGGFGVGGFGQTAFGGSTFGAQPAAPAVGFGSAGQVGQQQAAGGFGTTQERAWG